MNPVGFAPHDELPDLQVGVAPGWDPSSSGTTGSRSVRWEAGLLTSVAGGQPVPVIQ
jgi:hypothetical protein